MSTAIWNPQLYLKFGGARLLPALDLLNRAVFSVASTTRTTTSSSSVATSGPENVRTILDLGCGPGNITPFLANAFPNAIIYGVDASPNMINQARDTHSKTLHLRDRVKFSVNTVESCIEDTFLNGMTFDLVFSNACLHWLTNHKWLMPALSRRLLTPKTGVIAVQIPDTREQYSHLAMDEAANNTGLRAKLTGVRIPRAEGSRLFYLDALQNDLADLDIWTSQYLHLLPFNKVQEDGEKLHHPVLSFVKSTGLMPYVDALGGINSADCQLFLKEYERLLYIKYPPRVIDKEGAKVAALSYKRLFFIGRRL